MSEGEEGGSPAASPLVAQAYLVAEEAHQGQHRKADGESYIEHVGKVSDRVAAAGFGPEVVAAALLHDVVEHTDTSNDDLGEVFGERVAELVGAMTDREEIEPWESRKREHRDRIEASGRDGCAIYAADKIAGVGEARAGFAAVGAKVEERLGNTLDARIRVWRDDLRMLGRVEPPLELTSVLREELRGLEADIERPAGSSGPV